MENETQAEPARRKRGGLLIEPAGRTLEFGVPARSTGGGGPTDTDSAVNLNCDDPCSSSQSVFIRVLFIGVFLPSWLRRCYGEFLRAVVRWLNIVLVFAMSFAFLAIFAVKQRCVLAVNQGL